MPGDDALMATLQTQASANGPAAARLFAEVNLDVSSREVVGLLGPNGAGKTTTFYMTVGLTATNSGRVLLDGQEITDDPMYIRARKGIGYLPQEPSIFRGLTVEQNILAILETMSMGAAARRVRLRELLAELNLTPLAHGARLHALRRRTAAPRDRPRAGHRAETDPARRAVRRHRSDRRRRHSENRPPPPRSRHRHPDHRSQRPRSSADTDRAYIVHGGVIFKSGTPARLAADEEVRRIYLGTEFPVRLK